MEQYFRVVRAESEDLKVSMAMIYLSKDAKVWWRTKHDDIQHERYMIVGMYNQIDNLINPPNPT